MFVVPFNFSHLQQTVDQVSATALARETSGRFVLDNIPALESSGAIHRRKPPHDVAQKTESATDDGGTSFTRLTRLSVETFKHLTHEFAMTPFVLLDSVNRLAFIRASD